MRWLKRWLGEKKLHPNPSSTCPPPANAPTSITKEEEPLDFERLLFRQAPDY
jgi:hypothetical protein